MVSECQVFLGSYLGYWGVCDRLIAMGFLAVSVISVFISLRARRRQKQKMNF